MNSTVIGDYHHPTVRFSGSGGACDAGSLASAYIVFMQHGVQQFVEQLDYLTTPGWLRAATAQARRLPPRRPPGRGHRPVRAEFDEVTHEMYLAERYEGVTRDSCASTRASPWTVARRAGHAAHGRGAAILRDEVDPQRLILG